MLVVPWLMLLQLQWRNLRIASLTYSFVAERGLKFSKVNYHSISVYMKIVSCLLYDLNHPDLV